MKILKMQKRNKHSYFATISISDYDIEMLENLAYCYCNKASDKKKNPVLIELKTKYSKWLKNQFREFQKLWKKFD